MWSGPCIYVVLYSLFTVLSGVAPESRRDARALLQIPWRNASLLRTQPSLSQVTQQVHVEDFCVGGKCEQMFKTHNEMRCQKYVPKESFSLLECFDTVMRTWANDSNNKAARLDYFLFMGTNLAAARGGELMPYDHDLDVTVNADGKHFEQLWGSPEKLQKHMATVPACALAKPRVETSYMVDGVEHFQQIWPGGSESAIINGSKKNAFRVWGEGKVSLDLWPMQFDPGNVSEVCHWGTCAAIKDVYPLRRCTLKSSILQLSVDVQCMHNPESLAAFYSKPKAQEHFRSSDWKIPMFNVWDDKKGEWEWDETTWQAHVLGKSDMFVYNWTNVTASS